MPKRKDRKPELSMRLIDEHHTHDTVVENCIDNLRGGRRFQDWVNFMKQEYDITEPLVRYVKKRVAILAFKLNLLN